MKVWHVYLVRNMQPVNGVVTVVGRLCEGLVELDARPRFFVLAQDVNEVNVPPQARSCLEVHDNALRLGRRWAQLLASGERPDIVHFHEVMRPPHRWLAQRLGREGIPWVLTTHGGLAPGSLARDRWKKVPYGVLIERRFLRQASAIVAIYPGERDHVATFVGSATPPMPVVPNAVAESVFSLPRWSAGDEKDSAAPTRVATLCRFDVRQKGLDRLADIARAAPEIEFSAFGVQCKNDPQLTERIKREAPSNFTFRDAVFGTAKLELLSSLDLFIQPSRWESLSSALCEAMALGVPCAVSRAVAQTMPFGPLDLGLVLDDDPRIAAAQIRAATTDRIQLAGWSHRAASYVREHFAATAVARDHLEVYDRVLDEVRPAETGRGRPDRPAAALTPLGPDIEPG